MAQKSRGFECSTAHLLHLSRSRGHLKRNKSPLWQSRRFHRVNGTHKSFCSLIKRGNREDKGLKNGGRLNSRAVQSSLFAQPLITLSLQQFHWAPHWKNNKRNDEWKWFLSPTSTKRQKRRRLCFRSSSVINCSSSLFLHLCPMKKLTKLRVRLEEQLWGKNGKILLLHRKSPSMWLVIGPITDWHASG